MAPRRKTAKRKTQSTVTAPRRKVAKSKAQPKILQPQESIPQPMTLDQVKDEMWTDEVSVIAERLLEPLIINLSLSRKWPPLEYAKVKAGEDLKEADIDYQKGKVVRIKNGLGILRNLLLGKNQPHNLNELLRSEEPIRQALDRLYGSHKPALHKPFLGDNVKSRAKQDDRWEKKTFPANLLLEALNETRSMKPKCFTKKQSDAMEHWFSKEENWHPAKPTRVKGSSGDDQEEADEDPADEEIEVTNKVPATHDSQTSEANQQEVEEEEEEEDPQGQSKGSKEIKKLQADKKRLADKVKFLQTELEDFKRAYQELANMCDPCAACIELKDQLTAQKTLCAQEKLELQTANEKLRKEASILIATINQLNARNDTHQAHGNRSESSFSSDSGDDNGNGEDGGEAEEGPEDEGHEKNNDQGQGFDEEDNDEDMPPAELSGVGSQDDAWNKAWSKGWTRSQAGQSRGTSPEKRKSTEVPPRENKRQKQVVEQSLVPLNQRDQLAKNDTSLPTPPTTNQTTRSQQQAGIQRMMQQGGSARAALLSSEDSPSNRVRKSSAMAFQRLAASVLNPRSYDSSFAHPPEDMLNRIDRFLSDQSIYQKPSWREVFSETMEYINRLIASGTAREYRSKLKRVLNRLQTHKVWVDHSDATLQIDRRVIKMWEQTPPADRLSLLGDPSSEVPTVNMLGTRPLPYDPKNRPTPEPIGMLIAQPSPPDGASALLKDPFAYSMALHQFNRDEALWASHARKAGQDEKNDGTQASDLLASPVWKGPVPTMSLTKQGRETLQVLKTYRAMEGAILFTAKRSSRPFIKRLVKMIELGKKRPQSIADQGLLFREDEMTPVAGNQHSAYAPVAMHELDWLRYILARQSIPNDPDSDPSQAIFIDRVTALIDDPAKDHFADGVDNDELLKLVNNHPDDRHKFNWDDSTVIALSSLLQYEYLSSGKGTHMRHYFRGNPTLHPEDRIVWKCGNPKDHPKETALQVGTSDHLNQETVSTKDVPVVAKLISWQEARANAEQIAKSHDMRFTVNFYSCLAFRLGWTLADEGLPSIHGKNVDEAVSKLNTNHSKLVRESQKIESMTEDVKIRTTDETSSSGRRRISRPKYIDIIRQIDPLASKNQKGEDLTESEAAEVVRKAVLDELHQNKSAIWVPGSGEESAGQFKRQKLWSWADPEIVGEKEKSWDLDRWPCNDPFRKKLSPLDGDEVSEADSEERRMDNLRCKTYRGLSVDHLKDELAFLEEYSNPDDDDNEVTVHWRDMPTKKKIIEGQVEYWKGDTPSQQRSFEDRLRQQYETPEYFAAAKREREKSLSRKRSWLEYIGLRKRDEIEDESRIEQNELPLPKVHPSKIRRTISPPGGSRLPLLRREHEQELKAIVEKWDKQQKQKSDDKELR